MRGVRRGKLDTIELIRVKLAKGSHADYACPMSTEIFVKMAAQAAEEDLADGRTSITPYWRVTKNDSGLNGKPSHTIH